MCICCLPWKTFVNFPAHLIEIHLVPTDSRERREGQNFHNYFPSYCLLWPSARDNFSFQGKFCFIFTFSAVLLSNLLRGNLQEYRKSFQLWMLFKIRNSLQYRWNKYTSEGSKNFLFVSLTLTLNVILVSWYFVKTHTDFSIYSYYCSEVGLRWFFH